MNVNGAGAVYLYTALFYSAWVLWIPVTFWFGRIFCRYVCLLGLSQSLVNFVFHRKTHVRRVCEALPRPWYQRVVNWTIVAAYFLLPWFVAPFAAWVNPWGIVGRVVVLFVPGVLFFAAILVTAAFGKGRFWCNWICPLGTIFDFVANVGLHRDRPCASCRHCRRCIS